jgi:26S proteasome regulatory subunit N3
MPLENMEVNFQQETLVTDVSLDKLTREGKEESCKKVIDLIKRNVLLLEKGVSTKENRFFSRVVRNLSTLKKKLTAEILFVCISQLITDLSPDKPFLLSFLNSFDESLLLKKDKMDIDNTSEVNKEEHKENISYVPEVDVYLQLLVLLWLIRQNRSTDAISCADNLVERFQAHKRRTLDILYARVYFYYALVYETADRANEIRKPLMLALRTATLRHNFESQSTLTNLLIRNFILYKLYDAAEKFISRCSFPEVASNNEWARYHYYLGRTKAVRLQYSEAKEHLEESLRKAPQNSALGFQQEVQKWLVVVHLLLGLIPDRLFFQRATMGKALIPYLAITYGLSFFNY